jgi:predicted nuclease with TOPRIM domain
MDIKEARRICREVANQNQALTMLAGAVDAIESGLTEVNIAKTTLAYLRNEMKPLEEKRDMVTQKIVAMETHYINAKNDLEAEHDEYIKCHNDRMKKLTESSVAEASILEAKNNTLRGESSNLENNIIDKQQQLNDINDILNKKR